MNFHIEAKHSNYDVIIIGSGMGGLTTAAILAKMKKKVLVIERNSIPGGAAQSFKRKNYIFDSSVHQIGGADSETGFLNKIFKILGVNELFNLIRIDPFYSVTFPDDKYKIPLGIQEFTEYYCSRFPHEQKGISEFVSIMFKFIEEGRSMPAKSSIWEKLTMPLHYPTLVKYYKATLEEVINEFIKDQKLKAALTSLWPYLGLPPKEISFFAWAYMMSSYISEGSYYCEGSFENMVNAFVEVIKSNEGELIFNSSVKRVLVEDKKVIGVKLENGQEIKADVVICNTSIKQTVEELVGCDKLPSKYVRRLNMLKPSTSTYMMYMATDMDFKNKDVQHEMLFYNSWDYNNIYKDIDKGSIGNLLVTIPSLADPTVAPEGEHIFIAASLQKYKSGHYWRDEKDNFSQRVLDEVEKYFPDFRKHIKFSESATPRTIERYTLNSQGAIYGLENNPNQMNNRPKQETPIKGLYLCGHWVRPGAGVYSVIVSGLQVSQKVLGYSSTCKLLEDMSR